MIKKFFKRGNKTNREKDKNQLLPEIEEIRNISERILKNLEKKIEILEAIEASIDEKMATFERILNRAESLETPSDSISRQHEILNLNRRKLRADEIASILNIPEGEVELILNLGR